MADDLFDVLGKVSDSLGVTGAPIKGVRAWLRRDEARNLLRTLQRELDARWGQDETRGDLYEQIARHMQNSELWVPFEAAAGGDASSLDAIEKYLTEHLGTPSGAASKEVAQVVVNVLANNLGRAQTSPEAAVDTVSRLRHEQAERRFDEVGERLNTLADQVTSGNREIFEAIRDDTSQTGAAGLAQALVLGPLKRIGAVDAVQAAEKAAANGDPGGGAEALLSIAVRLDDARIGVAAESLRERAAGLLQDAGRPADVAAVLLDVTRARIDRDATLASSTVELLRDSVGHDEAWVAEALEAVVDWPGRGVEPLETLRRAATLSAERSDHLWFVAAAVDLFCLFGQHEEALELAAPVRAMPLADGERLAIELDLLEAHEAVGDSTSAETRWLEVLRWADVEGSAHSAGFAWQRRGVALAEREEVSLAHDAYRRAMAAWADIEGFEEQAADAFYSMQQVSIANAKPIPDPELRPLAYSLRGSPVTPAARIERLISDGMRQRLRERGEPAALRALWKAFALARKSGSLISTQEAAQRLAELHAHAGEPYIALSFYLTAGQGKEAAELAKALDPAKVAPLLQVGGSRWYRTSVLQVVAAIGRGLPEATVHEFAAAILAEAADEADAWVGPQPALAAKRALAAISLAVPDALAAATFDQLIKGLSHGQVDVVRANSEALILATNVQVHDATGPVLDLFLRDPYNYRISMAWVAERIKDAPENAPAIRSAALAGNEPALQALVISGLVDDELSAFCDQRAKSWTTFEPTEESIVDGVRQHKTGIGVVADGAGILGRCASPRVRARLLARMLEVTCGHADPEDTRAGAARAIHNLAPALTTQQAADATARLAPVAEGLYELSRWDTNLDHPLSSILISMHQPGVLQAAALITLGRLAAEHPELGRAAPTAAVEAALRDGQETVVAAAFQVLAQLPEVDSPVPLEVAMRHPDITVRQAAVTAFVNRHGKMPPDEILRGLLSDPFPRMRLALIALGVDLPDPERALQPLADDGDAYVRLRARRSLDDAARGIQRSRLGTE